MNEKIYVFDLDGTLVFNGREIAPSITRELCRINSFARIIFASARPVRDMLPLLKDFPENDLIGGNGSIVRKNGKVSTTKVLNVQFVQELLDFAEQNQLEFVVDYAWNYTAKVSPKNDILNKLDVGHYAKNVALSMENVSKLILFAVTREQFESLKAADRAEMLYHEDVKELVVTASNINKYQLLRRLIADKTYTAFGNDKNDLALLSHAELAVAVGENREIKALSDVCLPVDSSEIAEFLTRIIK